MSKVQSTESYVERSSEMIDGIIRLKPQQFIHVLDNNTDVTRLEVGPQTITLRDRERLILKPSPMIVVPPRYYCIVSNPVLRDETGQPIEDRYGQIQLRYGDRSHPLRTGASHKSKSIFYKVGKLSGLISDLVKS